MLLCEMVSESNGASKSTLTIIGDIIAIAVLGIFSLNFASFADNSGVPAEELTSAFQLPTLFCVNLINKLAAPPFNVFFYVSVVFLSFL